MVTDKVQHMLNIPIRVIVNNSIYKIHYRPKSVVMDPALRRCPTLTTNSQHLKGLFNNSISLTERGQVTRLHD